jgi:hypothetical protein
VISRSPVALSGSKDGANHDFTAAFGASSSGLTIHCNERMNEEAADRLAAHCSIRKYSRKALSWFGLLLSPGTAAVRFGLKLEGEWRQDAAMEEAVRQMPANVTPAKIKDALTRIIREVSPIEVSRAQRNADCRGADDAGRSRFGVAPRVLSGAVSPVVQGGNLARRAASVAKPI